MERYDEFTSAEQAFVRRCRKAGLSKAGSDFVRVAVDPMADSFLAPPSVPDGSGGVSVRRCVKQSFSISRPSTVAAGNPWDSHIQLWPMLTEYKASRFKRPAGAAQLGNNCIDYDNTLQKPIGGVCAYSGPVGANFSFASPLIEFAGQAALDPVYEQGASRIVAVGIEVINTSAPLYKSGSVVVFDLNQSAMNKTSAFTVVSTTYPMANQSVPSSWVRRPPLTFDDAMLLPGSRQWEAEKGCYLVATRSTQDYEPRLPDYVQPFMPLDEVEDDIQVGGGSPSNHNELFGPSLTFLVPPDFTGGQFSVPAVKLHPFNMKGAVFTGLSSDSSLQVYVNYYIETFPSPAQKDLLVLARPVASKDQRALQLVSLLMSKMVVGVPSNFNSEGDWFRMIVDKVTQWAPIIGTMFGQPEIGLAASVAAQALDSFIAPQSPQSRPALTDRPRNAAAKKKPVVNNNKNKNRRNMQNGPKKNKAATG